MTESEQLTDLALCEQLVADVWSCGAGELLDELVDEAYRENHPGGDHRLSLVSIFYMLKRNEPFDPPEANA